VERATTQLNNQPLQAQSRTMLHEESGNNFNLEEAIQSILSKLSQKERTILEYRFGLNKKDILSLGKIGQIFHLSRERVRQIQKNTLLKIRQNKKSLNFLNPLYNLIIDLIAQKGGIIPHSLLMEKLTKNQKELQKALIFILSLNEAIRFHKESKKTKAYWALKTKSSVEIEASIEQVRDALNAASRPLTIKQIIQLTKLNFNPSNLSSLLEISQEIVARNGQYGLSHWPEINPKSINAKVYFVLKKHGKPLHFEKITKMIQKITPTKKIKTPAVHNELVKDPRFVRIGRGIYALASWGYKGGTVKNTITQILENNSPLTEEEIIDKVLAAHQVKRNTIKANLRTNKEFKKLPGGYYSLEKEVSYGI